MWIVAFLVGLAVLFVVAVLVRRSRRPSQR